MSIFGDVLSYFVCFKCCCCKNRIRLVHCHFCTNTTIKLFMVLRHDSKANKELYPKYSSSVDMYQRTTLVAKETFSSSYINGHVLFCCDVSIPCSFYLSHLVYSFAYTTGCDSQALTHCFYFCLLFNSLTLQSCLLCF